jgi:hypothetical protein
MQWPLALKCGGDAIYCQTRIYALRGVRRPGSQDVGGCAALIALEDERFNSSHGVLAPRVLANVAMFKKRHWRTKHWRWRRGIKTIAGLFGILRQQGVFLAHTAEIAIPFSCAN